MKTPQELMLEAVEMARKGMENNQGGPFGALIVRNGEIIARGNNQVTSYNDPTAHAEVVAIRNACSELKDFNLNGCEIYTSCEPCPMCLAAIYWARLDAIYFAANRVDAASIGFDDEFLYKEMRYELQDRSLPIQHVDCHAVKGLFADWLDKEDKIAY